MKPGATIIPVIISFDKTQLTLFRNKCAYPVYMTISNLPKDIRRKPSCWGHILLAYLPVTRLEHVTNQAAYWRMLSNLFHACMGRVLEPLKTAGVDGVLMSSGDGVVWRAHPILAVFVTLALLRPYIICLTRGSNSQPHYDNSHYQLLHSLSYATPLV